ncbi:MAG: hypothetical protein GXO27_03785 [Chlorobi bacterium]|nr:hypothetical protein [Chlorobiota bacterium]
MKRLLIFTFILTMALSGCKKKEPEQPQDEGPAFEVIGPLGNVVESGREFVFHTFGPSATLGLKIRNLKDNPIRLYTMLVESSTGTGDEFEVCFGNCYPRMDIGVPYPLDGPYVLDGGATTPDGALHYVNYDSQEVRYRVKIYEVDESGEPTGEEFEFIYRYEP